MVDSEIENAVVLPSEEIVVPADEEEDIELSEDMVVEASGEVTVELPALSRLLVDVLTEEPKANALDCDIVVVIPSDTDALAKGALGRHLRTDAPMS